LRTPASSELAGHEAEAGPPPGDLAVFLREPERDANGFLYGADGFEHPRAVFRRGGGGFEIPLEIGLLERKQLRAEDRQDAGGADQVLLGGA
jgi:hypothetical protein